MMKRAFEGTEFAALEEHLEGPSAIAISKDDATAPARILCKFAKDAKALELKGGVVEGTAYDVAALTELAKIPSREELLSRLPWKHAVTDRKTLPALSSRSRSRVERAAPAQESTEAPAEEAPAAEAEAPAETPAE